MNWEISKEQCKHYHHCSAPLCPLESLPGIQVWTPNDEVCHNPRPPFWVKRQIKLKQRSKEKDTCYTMEMIKHKCMIKQNIMGIELGKTNSITMKRVKQWMRDHKLKKPLSVKEREERRKRLEKARLTRHSS